MRPVLLLLLLATSGCVTQKTFDALKTERDGLETTLEEKNKALGELEARQKKLAADKQSLEAQLAEEQDKAKDLGARIDRLHTDMANVTKDKSRLQASVEEMTRALAELEKRRAEAEGRISEFKNLIARFRSLIDAGKLKVKIVEGRMVVVLATDILFASGSASLSKDGKAAIAEVGQVLASIPKRSFQVEGHTDNVPIGTAQYPSNWELAAARAITVLKSMVEAGLPAERISAASFAETRPVASNDSKETKAQNRRIEIIIVPDLSQLPGFEELKALDAKQ
ncbi:MAG: OmpA family protein [Archangium sp.]|nr:OmpA family protein [Archangium sp.]